MSNPMDIHLILDEIFRKLEQKDLLGCRLVCHKWNERTTPIVQRHGPRILFQTSKDMDQILPQIQQTGGNRSFLAIGNSEFVQCGRLILNVKATYDEYQELIDRCAHTINYLEVIGGQQGRNGNTGPILRNWLLKMAELDTFKIEVPAIYDSTAIFNQYDNAFKLDSIRELSLNKVGGSGRLTATLFDDFFRRSQKLRRLSIDADKIFDEDLDEEPVPCLQSVAILNVDVILKSLEDYSNLKLLKSMKFNRLGNSNITSLLRLAGKELNLNSFELTRNWKSYGFHYTPFDNIGLGEFLISQKTSLLKLVLSAAEMQQISYQLTDFEVLDLEIYVGPGHVWRRSPLRPGSRPPPPSFCFPGMFPHLTSLKLKGSGMSSYVDEFFAETHTIIPSKTLRHLRLPPGKLTTKEGVAESFSKLFPNIISLDVRLPTTEFLHGIWKYWPELTDLKLVCVSKPKAIQKPKFGYHKPKFGLNQKPTFGYKKPKLRNLSPTFPFRFVIPGWGNDKLKPGEQRHCYFLDHGFTGIDNKICAQIQESGWTPGNNAANIIQQSKITFSIADLKKLKRLELQFVSEMKKGATRQAKLVSDIFIYTALMQMPQLEELTITEKLLNIDRRFEHHTSDLSLEAVQDLKKALISTKIHITSTSVQINWEEPYRNYNYNSFIPIHIHEIADYDKKPYTTIQASTICRSRKPPAPKWYQYHGAKRNRSEPK